MPNNCARAKVAEKRYRRPGIPVVVARLPKQTGIFEGRGEKHHVAEEKDEQHYRTEADCETSAKNTHLAAIAERAGCRIEQGVCWQLRRG